MFTTAPILAQFDPDRETVVEADSSGYAAGGVLSQYDDEGLLIFLEEELTGGV